MTTETQHPALDPFEQMKTAAATVLTSLIGEANQAQAVVKSAQNENGVIADLIETSDDDMVVAYRAKVEEAEAAMLDWEKKITEHIKANLLPKGEKVDVEGATATYKEKVAAIKQFRGTLLAIPGGEEIAKTLPELKSLGRGGVAGATGTKRPRVDTLEVRLHDSDEWTSVSSTVKDPKAEGGTKTVVSFSVLAQKLKGEPYNVNLSATELREHAEGEAGDSSTWGERNGKPFTFAVSRDDKHLMVRVTPEAKGSTTANDESDNTDEAVNE
jgi:hypothetical protein